MNMRHSGHEMRGKTGRFWRSVSNEAVVAAVVLAAQGTFLVVPRPTLPRVVPLPALDPGAIEQREARETQRAERVRDGSLPRSARIVGELVRQLGKQSSRHHGVARQIQNELRLETQKVMERHGPEELLDLRALQTQLFVEEVERYVATGVVTPALLELGGEFAEIARESWVHHGRLLLSEPELRLLYRVRWGILTGTHRQEPFGPSLAEFRRYYAAYLEKPERGLVADPTSLALTRLSYAKALGSVDPQYPAELAMGILELSAGRGASAKKHLSAAAQATKSGEWSLVTRNYLISASLGAPTNE